MLPVKGYGELSGNIVTVSEKINALTTAVIYGANASGKSNVIKALTDFIDFVTSSSQHIINDPINIYDPFLLDKSSVKNPTEFELEFVIDKVRYIYSVSCNAERIIDEQLSYYPKGQTVLIFKRENTTDFKYGTVLKGEKRSIEYRMLQNQLYLSKAANENLDMLIDVYSWFSDITNSLSAMSSLGEYLNMSTIIGSALKEKDDKFFKKLENIIKAFDIGIDSLVIKENTRGKNLLSMIPEEATEFYSSTFMAEEIPDLDFELFAIHKGYSKDSEKPVFKEFPIEKESGGTKNLLTIAFNLLDHFKKGSVMIIDEFERSLHPHIVTKLVQLFQDHELNVNHAQLIFSTHAINLLDNELFRRDQVWFTEKDENGVTDLYALSQVEGVRKDTPYDKWYLSGRFGATPVLNEPDLNIADEVPEGN